MTGNVQHSQYSNRVACGHSRVFLTRDRDSIAQRASVLDLRFDLRLLRALQAHVKSKITRVSLRVGHS
jgi:hypothetical protein